MDARAPHMNISAEELAHVLDGEVVRDGTGRLQVSAPGPGHSKKDRSMSVLPDPSAPDGFIVNSFTKDDPLACRDYINERLGRPAWRPPESREDILRRMAAKARAAQRANGHDEPRSHKVGEYDYKLADGTLYLRVERYEPKTFKQRHWTGSGWAWGKPDGPKIPYRLPEVVRADQVFICEGEKDADAVCEKARCVATTASEGAGKWTPDLNEWFQGKVVFILPDNDEPGRAHAGKVAASLHEVAREVRVVALPGLPEKGDVSDWLATESNDPNKLLDIARAAPLWEPKAESSSAKDESGPTTEDEFDTPKVKLIKTSAEFVEGFTPPDYLIDGLLQRQFIYSFTGKTGSGKTAVALLISYCVAEGISIGEREVQAGRVIYFAGENPDDVRQRWIAMAEHLKFDINSIDVHFVEGVCNLAELEARLREEIAETGPATLVIIDTTAAYFLGEDENSNPAMGAYARELRRFTTFPGGPTVLANSHPVKHASADNLLPRGGGSFLAEVDGNLTCAANDTLVTVHWQGKFRGAEFEPLTFETKSVTAERLKDSRGRQIYTVLATQLSHGDISTRKGETRAREDEVLIYMLDAEQPPSVAAIAEHLNFMDAKGQPMKAKASRVLKRLKADKLIANERGESYALTEKGRKSAKQAKYNRDAAGATYG